jgi:hypothetical protein
MHAGLLASPMARTRGAPRSIATILSLTLCLWFVVYATHVHPQDDLPPAQGTVHHCDFCLARPASAAPPPAEIHVPVAVLFEVTPPSSDAPVVARDAAPSSYLSRAPPAA